MKTKIGFSTVIGLILWACSGTETQNPGDLTATFADSGCKKENGLESVGAGNGQALVSTDDEAATAGYDCVMWEISSERRLKIAFYNQDGACGAEWSGDVEALSTGGVRLSIENPGCRIAKCGTCLFDWSFELDQVDTSRDLEVTLSVDACPGNAKATETKLTLPLSKAAKGSRCSYAQYDAVLAQAGQLGTCGTQGMPCTSACGSDAATTPDCAGELTCVDNGTATERICAKRCTSDLDCDPLGVSVCSSGICRPKSD